MSLITTTRILRVKQINNLEIVLCDVGDAQILALVQSFCANGLNHSKGTLSVALTATATSPELAEVLCQVLFALSTTLRL